MPRCKHKSFFLRNGMTVFPFLLHLFTCQVQNITVSISVLNIREIELENLSTFYTDSGIPRNYFSQLWMHLILSQGCSCSNKHLEAQLYSNSASSLLLLVYVHSSCTHACLPTSSLENDGWNETPEKSVTVRTVRWGTSTLECVGCIGILLLISTVRGISAYVLREFVWMQAADKQATWAVPKKKE
jgi:hypothetical protein